MICTPHTAGETLEAYHTISLANARAVIDVFCGRKPQNCLTNCEVADADATVVVEVAETIAAVTGTITKRVADADIAIKKRHLYILYRKGET